MPVEVIDESGPSRDDAAAATAALPNGESPPPARATEILLRDEGAAQPLGDDASETPSPLCVSAATIATSILECLGRANAELSVAFVDDDRMRELNRDWRGKDSTTDVLSFSQMEGEPFSSPTELLGDVVISVPVLERQAVDGGWTVDEELARLLLHGVLHLLGFDHESDEDARAMRFEEGRIVAALTARGISCAWEGDAA